MRQHTFTIALLALCVAVTAVAQEQQAAQRERDATDQNQRRERTALRVSPDGTDAAQSLDQGIAACLILGNNEEVALARFAQERTQNPEVKQFVEQMIEQHQQAASQLEKFAPQNVSLELDAQATDDRTRPAPADRTARNADRQDRNATARTGEGHDELKQQMLAMQKDIAQKCLALTQRELSEHEGAKFDKCYIGQQIGAHIGMLAKLSGSEQYASSELQSVLAQQQQTVEQHLQHAKQIMQQLETRPETARRPTAPQQ
jgi:predicted outer membrane protein